MREVVFWFDYNSPYSMLAHERIEGVLAGLDVDVLYRPRVTDVRKPDYDSPKVQYVVEDVIRHARRCGLVLHPGPYVDLGAARRGFLLARGCGRGRAYNEGVHRARWREGRDISQPEVLRAIAAECGLDADSFSEALAGGRFDDAMEVERADAIAAGVFGVPFFEFAGEKFWGNDRVEWLLAAIRRSERKSGPQRRLAAGATGG